MSLLSRLAVQAARAYGILSSRSNNISADYLVVAGGGGGGFDIGGGGGAGGYQTSTATLSTLNTYSITVGAGGNGSSSSSAKGSNGANSVISGTGLTTVTSVGGGGGGTNNTGLYTGSTGGSGGGSSSLSTTSASGTAGQGNAGGAGNNNLASGGGGGAGAAGAAGSGTSASGNGGNGLSSSISGSSVTYAGGGGGGGYSGSASVGTGGTGGGGAGVKTGTATSGTVNTGGGGGGGGSAGGAGGSGIVIISYTSATPKFVGGTITTSGGKQIHTFTSSGTLSPITPITASYLVVAGGGGGGSSGGGGGAGGLLTNSTTLYSGATYVVTVGAGGNGGAANATTGTASSGSSSSLSGTGLTTLTATGGGGGGNYSVSGATGGSGGGAGRDSGSGGTGTSGQGFAGGATGVTGASGGAGGGGGSSAVGSAGVTNGTGNGGAGTASSISGTSVTYAGGGGGGGYNSGTNGTGGSGGGGTGGTNAAQSGVNGTPNTGGGGGGAGGAGGGSVAGAAGGSGIVIISYAGSQAFNGGLVTSSGGNTIHTFTATGALTPLTNNLNNSLRFRSSASAYLNRTPTIAGNRTTFTLSAWVKRGSLGSAQTLLSGGATGGTGTAQFIGFDTNDTFFFSNYNVGNLQTTQVFRDPSAWYHIVVSIDTTQATSANRIKMYVNGNQITAFSSSTYPSQNTNLYINTNEIQSIGRASWSGLYYFDGYMADINFIDGQALEPYYFGNNDANGVWKPIQYKGTYGTNGFYLTFGNTTSTTTLGYDSSPNGNNWTCNNISLTAGTTYDAMTDVPTNTSATVANYAVMNPLQVASATLSNANLSMARSGTGYGESSSTFSPEGNKGYFEITRSSTGDHLAGFILNSISPSTNNYTASGSYWYQCDTGSVKYGTGGSTATLITGCTSAPTGSQIIMVAFDFTGGNRNVWFGLQGTWGVNASSQTGVPSTGAFPHLTTTQLTDVCRLYFSSGDANTFSINFGQRPFTYTPPTGYVALNTYNLPTPTILQGNKYMDANLWTGNGVAQTIVNQGQFKPDLMWTKSRSVNGYYHVLIDSVRGITKALYSNATDAENTLATRITSINSNGYTVGSSGDMNDNAQTFVGWQWQAGQGSTSSNTSGSITSTVSVNTTAGFSVVTYTGTGANATVGHGLGVAPRMIIVKRRNQAEDWSVYHINIGATNKIFLDLTNATSADSTMWNNTTPTSSVFSIGTNTATNANTGTYVAYCFAEIAGFSAFGSYTGNGSIDGPFVYTGFRPKFILVKRTDTATYDWFIYDTSRDTYNVASNYLRPNLSNAEDIGATYDILSNGFKNRNAYLAINASGGTYIYAAYAENPFKNSNAR